MPTLSKDESLRVYLKIANLYYDLGLYRKFSFYLRQVAKQACFWFNSLILRKMASILVADNSELSKDLYLLSSPFYNFQNLTNKPFKEGRRNERVSPKLQIEFLNEFINACNHEPFR